MVDTEVSTHFVMHKLVIGTRGDSLQLFAHPSVVWSGGVVKGGVGLRLERSRIQLLAEPLSGNDLRQVVLTHVPLSSSTIIWYKSRGSQVLRLGR